MSAYIQLSRCSPIIVCSATCELSVVPLSTGITDYLTYRSNNDPQFFDLSQDYNYHIVDKTRPTLTITRNIRDNNQLAPFCVWRLDFTHSNWVLVSALKELYGECVKNYFSLRDERTVSYK